MIRPKQGPRTEAHPFRKAGSFFQDGLESGSRFDDEGLVGGLEGRRGVAQALQK
jgi:hypothetical protein